MNLFRNPRLSRRRLLRRGFSLMELLIVVAILMIIGAVAIPKVNIALMSAKESAAVRELHNLVTAQTQYMSTYGKYAQSLIELGPPSSGQASATSADLIPGEISKGEKNGYKFTLQGTPQGFSVSAVPSQFGSTGRFTYFVDATGVIRRNAGAEPATAQSPELK
jgi:prepilin-type N-terminal cleavage/methylation domain-containing protein